MPQLRLGISGWNYGSWRGTFYPDDLPKRQQLAYASRRFNSIEINGSFYALQRPDTYRTWYEETPHGFRFAVKGSRFITHHKKLKNVETPLANFLASGILLLKEKLGPSPFARLARNLCELLRGRGARPVGGTHPHVAIGGTTRRRRSDYRSPTATPQIP